MQRTRPGTGAELVPVLLILAGLGGTAGLLIAVQKRHLDELAAQKAPATVVAVASEPPKPAPVPIPPPPPHEPEPIAPPPSKPAEDPTPKAVAAIRSAELEQRRETTALATKTRDIERALEEVKGKAAAAGVALRKASEVSESLLARASQLEMEAAKASIEVDVLESRREEVKDEAQKLAGRNSYAILPHRGPNGTWRRPIVIECHDGQVSVRPKGGTFGLGELLELGFGNSTFRGSVAREAVRIQRGASPDGRSVVPYFYFLIRPDGIKSYYAARRQLEPLGITFGYELADDDWEIDFPDLDDPDNWSPETAKPGGLVGAGEGLDDLAARAFPGAGPGSGGTGKEENPFVWPGSPEGGRGRGKPDGALGSKPILGAVPPLGPPGGSGVDPTMTAPEEVPPSLDRPRELVLGGDGLGNGTGNGVATGTGSELGNGGKPAPILVPGLRNGLGAGGSGVTGDAGDGLPPNLGEAVAPKTPYEQAFARELAKRGVKPPTGSGTGGGTEVGTGEPGGEAGARSSAGAPGRPGAAGGGEPGSEFGGSRIAPLELTIACEARGVIIHPGDYRVTTKGLAGKEPILAGQLKALVQARRDAEPDKVVVPSIKFLVAPGGHSTYSTARGQLLLDGIDWPSSTQISGGDVVRGLSREDW